MILIVDGRSGECQPGPEGGGVSCGSSWRASPARTNATQRVAYRSCQFVEIPGVMPRPRRGVATGLSSGLSFTGGRMMLFQLF